MKSDFLTDLAFISVHINCPTNKEDILKDFITTKTCRSGQNRRQNVFRRGLYGCAGGLGIVKFDQTPLIYNVSYFDLEGLGTWFGGASPPKSTRSDGTGSGFGI